MSPRSQPVVIEIVGLDRSPKVAALMIGCWRRDIRLVCCLRWVKGSWWDLSAVLGFLLSLLRSANHISCHYWALLIQPTPRSEDPLWHQYGCIVCLSWFSWPPMLMNACSMNSPFLCHDHVLLHLHSTITTNMLTVSATLVPLLTHSLLLSIFS